MRYNNCEINILIKGRPITEYTHQGQQYVEGRSNSQFEIEFKNLNPFRIEAIFSVDGLSIIDGKEAGTQSSGYLLEANETLRIPGWKLTDQQVAAFVFSGKQGSYATQMTGTSKNNGVIGVMVFKEKTIHRPSTWIGGRIINRSPFYGSGCGTGTPDGWYDSYDSCVVGSSAPSLSVKSASPLRSLDIEEQNLGTGFGNATDFATQMVSFTRGDMIAMMVLYYDDRRGLEKRGIKIVRPSRQKIDNKPEAFPGMNCSPPPGWKR